MISVAELFQICVTAKGSVYTWGTTYCCELDVGHMCKVESPSSLDEKTFNIVPVLMAACGDFHSAILTVRVLVYTCGSGYFGQLGHSDN